VAELSEGEFFGEIALLTRLKRTASVFAQDFCQLAYINAPDFEELRMQFPALYKKFKDGIQLRYDDVNFRFRRQLLQNVPCFRHLSDQAIQQLVYLLKSKVCQPDSVIVRKGEVYDKICFLKQGEVSVEVPLFNDVLHFETLGVGSCFCFYSAFHPTYRQKFDFRAKTECLIETIRSQDILILER